MSVSINLPRRSAAPVTLVLPRNKSVDTVAVDPTALDNFGEIVPVWLPQAFSYDPNGNLETTTIVQGVKSWVRTMTYGNGVQLTDSGWVRQ